MPHHTRPMAALLIFTGLNAVLVSTIEPVYDFVCFHPYWERRERTSTTRTRGRSAEKFLIDIKDSWSGQETKILLLSALSLVMMLVS